MIVSPVIVYGSLMLSLSVFSKKTRLLKKEYWDTLAGQSKRAGITLESSNSADPTEFHVYGLRLADVMIKRFEKYGKTDTTHATILEIGCGIGRYVLPLACRFQKVHGVDISESIIEEAKRYCASVPNIELSVNDGCTLGGLEDGMFDYVLCTGVLQHIPHFEVILNYLHEAIRVLKVDGVLLFTFQAWQTEDIGKGRCGARITAQKLNDGMAEMPYEILELSLDPKDPMRHILVALRKTSSSEAVADLKRSFTELPITAAPYRTSVFEDLKTCQVMVELWKGPLRPLTFFDK